MALYGPIEELLYQLNPLVLFYEGETGQRDMRAIYDAILAEVNRPSLPERAGDIALAAVEGQGA